MDAGLKKIQGNGSRRNLCEFGIIVIIFYAQNITTARNTGEQILIILSQIRVVLRIFEFFSLFLRHFKDRIIKVIMIILLLKFI
jgi:hypothetical protein